MTRAGPRIAALQECVDAVLAYDARFRVAAISTPQSIYTDLQGRAEHPITGIVEAYEAALLRRARRFHACHPRLMGKSRQAEAVRRNWRPGA